MNIFFLDRDPYLAASYHHDIHVLSQIKEAAQIMSGVWWKTYSRHYVNIAEHTRLFGIKPVQLSHPCVLWTQENSLHYGWLLRLFDALCYEKRLRWPKNAPHILDGSTKLGGCPPDLIKGPWQDPFPVVAEEVKTTPYDAVASYRRYYRQYKTLYCKSYGAYGKKLPTPKFETNTWTNRGIPEWLLTA